jgi:type IV pilus assembly protein PilW
VDFGIDDVPDSFNFMTGFWGDGVPDRYSRNPLAAEYAHIVAVRAQILARNSERTFGYNDVKTYQLGLAGALGPRNDEYKRHAYAGLVRVTNMSGRREIPQ